MREVRLGRTGEEGEIRCGEGAVLREARFYFLLLFVVHNAEKKCLPLHQNFKLEKKAVKISDNAFPRLCRRPRQ